MSITLPLDKMSVSEKLQVIEDVWADLEKNADSIPSPAWHKDVLDERRQLVREGKAGHMDWEQAKKEIRSSLQ